MHALFVLFQGEDNNNNKEAIIFNKSETPMWTVQAFPRLAHFKMDLTFMEVTQPQGWASSH